MTFKLKDVVIANSLDPLINLSLDNSKCQSFDLTFRESCRNFLFLCLMAIEELNSLKGLTLKSKTVDV